MVQYLQPELRKAMNSTEKTERSGIATDDRLDVFANVRDLGPDELFQFLSQMVALLPDETRYRLKSVLESLPPEGDNLQRVLELVRRQWTGLVSEEWVRVGIVGPARTGKTSLQRAIERKQAPGARPIFTVLDVQGLEEYLGYQRPAVPEEIANIDIILLVLDARYGLSENTQTLYRKYAQLGKPVIVVLNKIDVVDYPAQTVRQARSVLKTSIFATSSLQPETINRLLKGIVSGEPRALYPLSQNFPEFRRVICNGTVTQSSFAAGLVGAIPLPVSDMLPMTAIQIAMLLKISRAFGFKINRSRARELIPVLAAGALIREGSHRLRKEFPEKAQLIAISVAGVWTYLLGWACVRYFERVSRFVHTGDVALQSVPEELFRKAQ